MLRNRAGYISAVIVVPLGPFFYNTTATQKLRVQGKVNCPAAAAVSFWTLAMGEGEEGWM